jgi:hypothetical protein
MKTMTDLTESSRKQERLEMIRKSLQDMAPRTYAELETTGALQPFLEAHDAEMMLSFNEAKSKVWEETMSKFLEFADPIYEET